MQEVSRVPYRVRFVALTLLGICMLITVGCSSTAEPPRVGFISDYTHLESIDAHKARYISPRMSEYEVFMVDPVEFRVVREKAALTPQERADVANYLRESFTQVLRGSGYEVSDHAGVGVARVRFAITGIQESTWWMKVHPASKLAGAGVGGASMEGEIIDSVTGEQLAAVVKAGKGNQFEMDTFSKLDDVKDVIDNWAKEAEQRLAELREAKASQ